MRPELLRSRFISDRRLNARFGAESSPYTEPKAHQRTNSRQLSDEHFLITLLEVISATNVQSMIHHTIKQGLVNSFDDSHVTVIVFNAGLRP